LTGTAIDHGGIEQAAFHLLARGHGAALVTGRCTGLQARQLLQGSVGSRGQIDLGFIEFETGSCRRPRRIVIGRPVSVQLGAGNPCAERGAGGTAKAAIRKTVVAR